MALKGQHTVCCAYCILMGGRFAEFNVRRRRDNGGREREEISRHYVHICMLSHGKAYLRCTGIPCASVGGVINSGVGEGRLVVDSQVLFFYCHASPFSNT